MDHAGPSEEPEVAAEFRAPRLRRSSHRQLEHRHPDLHLSRSTEEEQLVTVTRYTRSRLTERFRGSWPRPAGSGVFRVRCHQEAPFSGFSSGARTRGKNPKHGYAGFIHTTNEQVHPHDQ
ncbi:hypothetical protein EYF80_033111 [Liparis tanakae]|uniref:Uncharacterized protein n=1 Tax=Liparis tanakae TaxID=230148 RepID=A0A4Z2GVU3_9TELE|nr:hypothetical protein EYF80_033111 [Liparis tanakae]